MPGSEEVADRLSALEARVRVLEDLEGIRLMKARYGELTDRRYAEGGLVGTADLERIADEIANLFTEDALWDGGRHLGVCRGRAGIRERFRNPTTTFGKHCFVNPRISVEGERARGTWDILAPCTLPGDRAYWMAGVEEDEYAKVEGVWLHASMKLTVVLLASHERGWAKRSSSSRG